MNKSKYFFNIFISFKYKKIILFFLIIIFIIYSFVWLIIAESIKIKLYKINSSTYNISINNIKVYGYPLSYKIKADKFNLHSTNYPKIKWSSDNLDGHTNLFKPYNFNFNFNKNEINFIRNINDKPIIETYIEKIFVQFDYRNIKNSRKIKFNIKNIKFNLIEGNLNYMIDNLNISIKRIVIDSQKKKYLVNMGLKNLIGKHKLFQIIGAPIKLSEAKVSFPSYNDEFNLNQWRKSGGVLDFEINKFEWGKIKINSYGTASIDKNMKPIGALTLDAQNINYLINSMQSAEIISSLQGSIIKIALKLFGSRLDENLMKIPITVQSENIFIGSLKISDTFLPSIDLKILK